MAFILGLNFRRLRRTLPRWPDYPAYWSLDPLGVEGLSTDEATRLGFPTIHLITEVERYSWDASVYAGLRQFHQAKGFGPDSQDVVRHLGHTLFQLSNEMDPLFAHGKLIILKRSTVLATNTPNGRAG